MGQRPGNVAWGWGDRVVLLAAVVALVLSVRFVSGIVFAPYPVEYREPGLVNTTKALLDGRNPYVWTEQPGGMNLYGIFYHLVMWGAAKAFGPGYVAHRLVALACTAASCLLVGWVIRRRGGRAPLAAAGGVLLFADLASRGLLNVMARPDSTGLLLMLLAIAIPWRLDYSWASLAVSGGLSALAWLSKAYFVVGFPIVVLYVALCRDLYKGFAAGFGWAIGMAGIVAGVDWIWPAYLNNTFFAPLGGTGGTFRHVLGQVGVYLRSVPGVVGLVVIGAGTAAWGYRRPTITPAFRAVEDTGGGEGLDTPGGVRDGRGWWRSGIVPADVGVFAVALGVGAVIFACVMGRHLGNWMTYVYHLVSPFAVIVAMGVAEQLCRRGGWVRNVVVAAVVVDLAIIAATTPSPWPDRRGDWAEWDRLLAGAREAYLPSPLAGIAYDQRKTVWDSGYTEYFAAGARYEPAGLRNVVETKWNEYLAGIGRGVRDRRFDVVVLPKRWGKYWVVYMDAEALRRGYRIAGELPVPLEQEDWVGEVWIRKE